MLIMDSVVHAIGERVVLDHACLALGAGEMVVLAGPPGSGKTSVLRIIAGTLAPLAGTVACNDILLDASYRRRYLTYAGTSAPLIRDYQLGDFLRVAAADSQLSDTQIIARSEEILGRLGLQARRDEPLAALSGSEMVKAMLAACLVGAPRLILLDQSLALLDDKDRAVAWDALRAAACEGAGLLISAYPEQLPPRCAARVLQIADGRIR